MPEILRAKAKARAARPLLRGRLGEGSKSEIPDTLTLLENHVYRFAGEIGKESGQRVSGKVNFQDPRLLAIGHGSDLIVLDAGLSKILVSDFSGRLKKTIPAWNEESFCVERQTGTLYALSGRERLIRVYDPKRNYAKVREVGIDCPEGLEPRRIAVNGCGDILVVVGNVRLAIYKRRQKRAVNVASAIPGAPGFTGICDATCFGPENFLILDRSGVIYHVDGEAMLLDCVKGKGFIARWRDPFYISSFQDIFFVLDHGRYPLTVFGPDGMSFFGVNFLLKRFGMKLPLLLYPELRLRPSLFKAIDESGPRPEDSPLTFRRPVSLGFATDGRLAVLDARDRCVRVLEPSGLQKNF